MTGQRWFVVLPWALVGLFLLGAGIVASGMLARHSTQQPMSADGTTGSYVARAAQQPRSGTRRLMHMVLEGQFDGPLQDTIIQRWHDPVDGTVCYIYLPVAVARSAGPGGLVQYGSANIGVLSCFAGPKPSS